MAAQEKFTLEVPLDASAIEGLEPGKVKVLAIDRQGQGISNIVEIGPNGKGCATFTFGQNPGEVRVLVGPKGASEDEMLKLETLRTLANENYWRNTSKVNLSALTIPYYFWKAWGAWCRTITISGRVVCPDNHPVPGARVCAYDRDYWFIWSSKRPVGCAVTDQHGEFRIKFKWCCNWKPWYWWNSRQWNLELGLAKKIIPELLWTSEGVPIPKPPAKPELEFLKQILGSKRAAEIQFPFESVQDETGRVSEAEAKITPEVLEILRKPLLDRIPLPPLQNLAIWPWVPWHPWQDCQPDITFSVTQDCGAPGTVLLDEGFDQTRWNIPNNYETTLTVGERACCIKPPPSIPTGVCTVISGVCGPNPVSLIGGNPGAPACAPEQLGYLHPGSADRPFGEEIEINGSIGSDVDFYRFEIKEGTSGVWTELRDTEVDEVPKSFIIRNPPETVWNVSFSQYFDTKRYFQTLAYYQRTHDPTSWGNNRAWNGGAENLLKWKTGNTLRNGLYRLRIHGWKLVDGELQDLGVLPLCGSAGPCELVFRIDNQYFRAMGGHPQDGTQDHPCGEGNVHLCTNEPETRILGVSIQSPGGGSKPITACKTVKIEPNDMLLVDFFAHDLEGHLGNYGLEVYWSIGSHHNLLALKGAQLSPLGDNSPFPAASQVGPTYEKALKDSTPATSPFWQGGAIRLQVPAHEAFPETCCYQLELVAHKRTLVSCGRSGHWNRTQVGFMVTV